MAPVRGLRRTRVFIGLAGLLLVTLAPAAFALRVVDYNLLNYPGSTGAIRDPYYRVTFNPLSADVIVTEEQHSQAGVDEFLNNVLNTLEPGQWVAAPFIVGGDSQCGFYYKPSKVQFLGQWGYYPNPANLLRLVNVYRLEPVGYSATAAEIRIFGVHLKASTGATNVAQRAAEAKGIRDTLDALPPGINAIVCGDFNFYTGLEAGMDTLLANRLSNRGQLSDPLGLQNVAWEDNASMAIHHTQCPSTTAYRPQGLGAAGGGLDDRFDLFLPTRELQDGAGVELIPSTYVAIGNDGLHLNKSVTDPPIAPADTAYARALWWGSDHLPVRVDLQLPAKVNAPNSPIAFGSYIVGATPPSQTLSVSNNATPPADQLRYTYSAPTGITTPAGLDSVAPGNTALDPIGLDTSAPINVSGNLALNSGDVDLPSLLVPISGTVLAHAVASLDSLTSTPTDSLNFGVHDAGSFSDELARVHNLGYDALHARLSVAGATITGPDAARFSIVGGFSPALVGVVAADWNIHFDDTAAPSGTTFDATLAFACADEPLPGAIAGPSVSLFLHAETTTGSTAVSGGHLPTVTRLYPPFPNPLSGQSTIRFDLARSASLQLNVFDLSGRRVARLEQGEFAPGSYSTQWNGRLTSGGSAGAGLYFIRMSGRGVPTSTMRLAVVR